MAQTLIFNGAQTQVINQLDTYNYTVNQAGMHVAKITIDVIPPSGMAILIKQNSSTIASFSSAAASQEAVNLSCTINAAMNDVISFVLSSSSAIDQGGNSFKAILDVHRGSSN